MDSMAAGSDTMDSMAAGSATTAAASATMDTMAAGSATMDSMAAGSDPNTADYLEFEMYMDHDMATAVLDEHREPVVEKEEWWQQPGPIPMSLPSPGSRGALRKYCRAVLAGHAKGPPVLLWQGRLSATRALWHLTKGNIEINAHRPDGPTVFFVSNFSPANFPGMTTTITKLDDVTVAYRMLETGTKDLEQLYE